MKIMVVDDKEENRYLLETLLTKSGYAVVQAANGQEALAILHDEKIDLIISDCLMPVMDGFELCRQCKADETLKKIPFIFCTASYPDKKDEEFGLALGAAEYIIKPFEPDNFIKTVKYVIAKAEKGQISKIKPTLADNALFKLYNERLVNKLAQKVSELYAENERRKQVEKEREKFTRELAEKNAELERFTYTVSHDLRSPLVTIKTFVGYLGQDIAAADAKRIEKDIFFINGATDKMEKLLGELLEMSRVGRIVNPSVEVTFKELVEEAIGIIAGPITDRGVKVQVSDESINFYGDRLRLAGIWQNLVENAVKFMGDQPDPQVDIGIEHHDHETVFFVRDNGIGIDPKYQSKLFNLFEKIDPKTEGTGMGLAITKRIVELYQGRIWVESKGEGQGTCFFFTLPGALKM